MSNTRGNGEHISTAKFLRGGSILYNTLPAGNKIVYGMDDPSHFGFVFCVDADTSGLFGTTNSGGTYYGYRDRMYSALDYLKNCKSDTTIVSSENGETAYGEGNQTFPEEYQNMYAFVNGFKTICANYPYVFQTIEGLADVYKRYFFAKEDPFLGGGTDNKIKITCLESADLRMNALFDAYMRAVYNHRYRRQNVPDNILRFDCTVLVHDLRKLYFGNNGSLGQTEQISKETLNKIVGNMSTVLFKFKDCLIDTEEIGASFASLGNVELAQTTFEFTFQYGDVDVYVNSLADILEGKLKEEERKDREVYNMLDVAVMQNGKDAPDRTKLDYFPIGQDNQYAQYNNGKTIGQALFDFGQKVYNSATSSSKFGNVYDNSVKGIVSSALSSIGGASIGNIISSMAYQGKNHLGEKIMNAIPEGPKKNFIGNLTNGMRF